MSNCKSCAHCGWEPDADYLICYNRKAIEAAGAEYSAFGKYITATDKACNDKFFEQHPSRARQTR